MTIPNVNPYTGNKPTPGQPQPEFNQNMSDELDYFNSLPNELNPAIDGINTTATQVANDAASAAASAAAAESAVENSGYAGLWPDTGGNALKGETWQTQVGGAPTGEYFVALQDTSADPIDDNENWRMVVTNSAITEAQNDIVDGSIFKGSNGEYAQNGDTAPTGSTHIRVLVGGKPYLFEMSPHASGVISNLTETGATIGASTVTFRSVKNPYGSETEIDVIIVYGQSNAKGYAGGTQGAPVNNTPLGRVWDGSEFIPLTSYTPTASDGISTGSAWAAFGNEYARLTGRKHVIINAAKGSQSIADLQKGGSVYAALTTWHNGAVAEILSEGNALGKVIMMFSQGEADAAAETSPVSYYNQLSQLWSDVQADFNAEIMGLYTTGYYADNRMIHGQAIQQAQRKFARDNDSVIIAYDKLGAFGSSNNLKVDSVHYTQRGYNIMGREGAKSVHNALWPDNLSPESNGLIERYGSMSMQQSQAWTMYCGIIRKIADGNWKINHSTPYASSMLLEANALSDRLQLKLNGDVGTVLKASSDFIGINKQNGMTASIGAGINPTSGIVSSTDSDGYTYVDLFFTTDLYLEINLATQSVTCPQGTSYSGILAEIADNITFPSTGRCDIAHPKINGRATGSIIGGTARSIRVNAAESLTILQLRDSSDALVNDEVTLVLPMVNVAPSLVADTSEINFELIGADYAIW